MKKYLLILILAIATFQPMFAKTYRGFTDIDGGITLCEGNYAPTIGLTTTHGVQLTEKFFIGAGLGFESVGVDGSFDFDDLSIPLYGDFRYDHWNNNKISFFAEFRLGYNIKWKGYMQNSIHINPIVGIRIRLNDRMGINIGLSYARYNKLYFEWYSDSYNFYRTVHHNAISLKAGIDF